MSKRQIRELLSKAMPYVKGAKQKLALFTAVLVLALCPVDFDSVHLHAESEPIVPSVNVGSMYASGNVSAQTTTFSSWSRL
jgi:hypothetical protein